MKLTTISVGVPVFRLNASVKHSIVRKPTVFERMVLRLSRRGQENQVVGDTTFRQAFEDHLGVQGVPQLLETTVSGLVRLGVLRSVIAPGQSHLDQPIRTFLLTAEGEEFYNKNTLPSSPTEDAVEYSYLPWSNSLVTSRPGRLIDLPPEAAFDEGLLRPRDPSSLVRRQLEDNRPRFLKRDSRIITVDAEINESVSWLTVDVEVHASPEGYLDLKTPNKSYENWLVKLEPAVVRETFLDAAIGQASAPDLELPREILRQAKRLTLATRPITPREPVISIPDASEGGLTIHLRRAGAAALSRQDETGRAAISCPAPSKVPPQLTSVTVVAAQPTSCEVEGEVSLTWSGALRHVRVQAELDGDNASQFWDPFSDDLAATLAASGDSRISTVPLRWGSDRPIDSLNQQLAGLPLSQTLEKIGEFLAAATESGLRFQSGHARMLAESIAARIQATPDEPILDIALVDDWLRFITGALGSDAPSTALRRALLSKATAPQSALEVRQLLALEKNPRQIPASLLGPTVLAAVLEELWNDPREELRTGTVEDLQTLEAYRAAQASLDASLGRHQADLATTGRRVVATKTVGEALRAAEHWLLTVDDPKLAKAIGNSFPSGLIQLRENVRVWRDAANANLAPPLELGKIALVFDSNTLLDYPEALRALTSSQIGVVPHRVIQELDGLKRSSDQSTAQKARAANRTLDDLREGNSIRFEKARADLIPPDFGASDDPDNQILSVAVAFSGSRVTLITGDKNLRNKAEASNIKVEDWPSLQEGTGKRR